MDNRQTRPFDVSYRRPPPDYRSGATAAPRQETNAESVLWSATIRGEPVPRHVARVIAVVRGMPQLVRSADARSWQNAALSQLLNRRPLRPLAHEMALDCHVWHRRKLGEIDDSLIVDVLERAAIIAGGRLVVERHLYARLDPDTPRIVVRLTSLDGRGKGIGIGGECEVTR
jgi:hypothetical protein